MKSLRGSLVCVATLSIFSACGTTNGGAATPAAATPAAPGRSPTCGGSVVGTWTIVSSNISIDVTKIQSDCPAATGAGKGITIAGEVTYDADGAYSEVSSFAGGLTINLPSTCIGPGLTCADLPRAFIGEMFQSASCAAGGNGCTCALTFAAAKHTETGTYTTPSTGLLSETETGAPASDLTDYCVDGAAMTQSPHPGSASGVSGQVVLKKR